jgi:hypothetical protein
MDMGATPKGTIERMQIIRFSTHFGFTYAVGLLFKSDGELGLRETYLDIEYNTSWELENVTC